MAKHRHRQPTREEERLMVLTGIRELDHLNRFLNAPDLPPEATKSQPPYDLYRLENEQAEKEASQDLIDRLYRMSSPPA